MSEQYVDLTVPVDTIPFITAALMQQAVEAMTAGDPRRGLALRALTQTIAEQCLDQWERFEAAGHTADMRATIERAACR